jgi:hypothetical protein
MSSLDVVARRFYDCYFWRNLRRVKGHREYLIVE